MCACYANRWGWGGLAPCVTEVRTGYCWRLCGEMELCLPYDVIDPGVSHVSVYCSVLTCCWYPGFWNMLWHWVCNCSCCRMWEQLLKIPGNDHCCDCGAVNPRWASINLGITLCIGKHRNLCSYFWYVISSGQSLTGAKSSGVPRGGVWGFQTPPLKISKALQNRAKLNPIVKTVNNCWI